MVCNGLFVNDNPLIIPELCFFKQWSGKNFLIVICIVLVFHFVQLAMHQPICKCRLNAILHKIILLAMLVCQHDILTMCFVSKPILPLAVDRKSTRLNSSHL